MSEDKKKTHYYSSQEKTAAQAKENPPKHTHGHSTAVTQASHGEFMCPECGKTFDSKNTAEGHLHSEHIEHLRSVHGEIHGKDTDTTHES